MVPVLLVALLTAAGTFVPLPARAPSAPQVPVCVVAHVAERDDEPADVELVRRLFLVRQRFWPGGGAAHPVNLPASSDVRDRFSRAVLGQSVRELVPYWNERYFHGTRPPPTVASEEAVILFVARTPGAVGYVEPGRTSDLPQGVRVLLCVPAAEGAPGG